MAALEQLSFLRILNFNTSPRHEDAEDRCEYSSLRFNESQDILLLSVEELLSTEPAERQ